MIVSCEYIDIFKTAQYVLNMFSVLFHACNEDWYRWMSGNANKLVNFVTFVVRFI